MSQTFILADLARARQFALIGRRAPRLFAGFEFLKDADGVAWALARVESLTVGVTWLGPSRVFDPHAVRQEADEMQDRRQKMQEASEDQHRRELNAVVQRVRLGRHCERLLWLVHQQLLDARSSVLKLPDFLLGAAVWGKDQGSWPRQWRQVLSEILTGLTWLHLGDGAGATAPALGRETALMTHAADLRGGDDDVCEELCPGWGGPPHHHFVVNAGRGFLGLLEQFAEENGDTGVRTYQFPVSGPRGSGTTLRRLGKTGELVSVYIPAKLGEPEACNTLTAGQHRLLQALVRETTRQSRNKGKRHSEVEVTRGNLIPGALGKGTIVCPILGPDEDRISFNGNGVRAGLGYYLGTPGGWLAKAGYGTTEVSTFLSDLAVLAGSLGLKVVGVTKGSKCCYDVQQLQALAASPTLRADLQRMLVRVYTRADYVERWNQFFSWDEAAAEKQQDGTAQLLDLFTRKSAKGISNRALALGIGVYPSYFGKVLNGKKAWPTGLLAKALAWVAGEQQPASPPLVPWPSLSLEGRSMLDIALAYRQKGWAVVPQRPGAKKPAVRWKRFQTVLPGQKDLESWFQIWPDAGLALVLGPVSGVFVIDVDGTDGHKAAR